MNNFYIKHPKFLFKGSVDDCDKVIKLLNEEGINWYIKENVYIFCENVDDINLAKKLVQRLFGFYI